MTNAVVTGGAGFIGSSLVRRLKERGWNVVVIDAFTYAACEENLAGVIGDASCSLVAGSIGDRALVADVLASCRPDLIFNLAAETHVDRSIDAPEDFFATNVVQTVAFLDMCRIYWRGLDAQTAGRFRVVHVSTDEVYGSVSQGQADEAAPLLPNSPYAASKAGGDMAVRSFQRTYGLPAVVTRGSNTFGPRQFPEKLIPRMILSALDGRTLPVYGDGAHERDWMHVDDHVGGIVAAAERGRCGEIYNLGAGSGLTNIELVRALCATLDRVRPRAGGGSYRDSIAFTADRPGHDRRYALDCRKAASELDWRPSYILSKGLAATVDWYLDHADWWQPILEGRYSLERLGLIDEAAK